MKNTVLTFCLLITWFLSKAQTDAAPPANEDKVRVEVRRDGVSVSKGDKDYVGHSKKKKKNKAGKTDGTLGLDIGIVNFQAPQVAAFPGLQSVGAPTVVGGAGNPNSLKISTAKSMNVNLYPVMYSLHLDRKASVNIITGLGFNWYNLRYENDIRMRKSVSPIIDTLFPGSTFEVEYYPNGTAVDKSKMAAAYLTAPLMLQLKPKVGGGRLVFGGGISAGYLIKGWYKVKNDGSKERYTQTFAFNPWQINAIGEFGINDKIRFYGSYALTNLYNKPLDQRTFTAGVRFFGL
ncbi:MAG: hypothetical protein RL660_141 [Bacteroidota bacterium]|jgi:hypothetical protein